MHTPFLQLQIVYNNDSASRGQGHRNSGADRGGIFRNRLQGIRPSQPEARGHQGTLLLSYLILFKANTQEAGLKGVVHPRKPKAPQHRHLLSGSTLSLPFY